MWYCGLFLIVANLLLRISLNKNKKKNEKDSLHVINSKYVVRL